MLTTKSSEKRLAELISEKVKKAIPGNDNPYADKFYSAVAAAIVQWISEQGNDAVDITSISAILQDGNVYVDGGRGNLA